MFLESDVDDAGFVRVIRKRKSDEDEPVDKEIKVKRGSSSYRASLRDQWANINIYQPDEFREKFRISKKSFVLLEELLERSFTKSLKNQRTGRSNITLRERLLMTLWTLSSQESFRKVAARYNVGEGTAHNIFIDTCNLIKELTKSYISLPNNFSSISKEFKEMDNCFPGVVGIVNCLDIPILTPIEDKASYYSPLVSTYALKMQTICDSRGRFLNVFIGYPGACYNVEMWSASRVYKLLSDKTISLPKNQHFIADASYPLDTFLMTPYKEGEIHDNRERTYNETLLATHKISQKAFSQLQGRFGRLKYMHMNKISDMKIVILAACILHNFVLLHEENAVNEEFAPTEATAPRSTEYDFFMELCEEILPEGSAVQANVKRHTISNELSRKVGDNSQVGNLPY